MKNRTEDDLQAGCVTWLRAQYPKLLFYHAKNEGNRKSLVMKSNGKSYSPDGSRNKRMGVLAGTPDLCIVRAKIEQPKRIDQLSPSEFYAELRVYHGMYIELKTPTGKQSPAQKEFQTRCISEGYKYVICRSIDEFMIVINEYLS